MKNLSIKLAIVTAVISFALSSLAMEQFNEDFNSLSITKKAKKSAKKKKPIIKGKFSWDHNEAVNASKTITDKYHTILDALTNLKDEDAINGATYEEARYVLFALLKHHQNNRKICEEFSKLGKSTHYEKSDVVKGRVNPELHPEYEDISFPEKAKFFSDCLFAAFNFAKLNDLLPDFFTYGIGSGSGCMEGRIGVINDWLRKSQENVERRTRASRNSKGILEFSVSESLMRYFHSRSKEIDALFLNDRAQEVIDSAVLDFTGMADLDGNTVTEENAKKTFLGIYGSMSPTKPNPSNNKHSDNDDEPSTARRKLFDNESF